MTHSGMIALVLAGVLVVAESATAVAGELRVVTTVPDLAWIVREVGGDRVDVKSICEGYQDPHYLEAKPSYTKDLRRADLLVYVGLELEVGWLPRLLQTARNPDLRPGAPGLVNASAAVGTLLEVPTGPVDRSRGDIHPFGNPHFLLDPRNIAPIGQVVADALTRVDPEGGPVYQAGAGRLREQMDSQVEAWESRAVALRARRIVAFHKQWEYLMAWLGLEIIGYVENRPGLPSSPRHVDSLIDTMKDRGVEVVVAAPFVDVHAAEEVARRASARLIVLPAAVGAEPGTEGYPSLIDLILDRLLEAHSGVD